MPTKNGAQYYGKPIPDFVMDTVKDLRGNRIKLDGNRIVGQAGPIYTSVSSYYSRKEAFKIRLYVNEDNKLDILQTKLGWLYESIKNMAKESTKGIKGDIIKYTFHSNDGLTVIYDAGQPYDDGYCSHETHDGHITISDSGKTLFYLKQYADVVSAYNYLQERIKLEYADVKGSIDDLLYNRLRNLRLDIEALIENNEVDVTNLSYNGQCR